MGNESQGKHFHASLYVNAGQVDEGAEMTGLPEWSSGSSSSSESGEQLVNASVRIRYEQKLGDGTKTGFEKEITRSISEKPGRVLLKPLASELTGTGYHPADETTTYEITLGEDGTVSYQGDDAAAAFGAVQDAYTDDESKEFDSGDGTEQAPYLIMNARQLDNVRNHLDAGVYYQLGRDIDLTGYQGASWADQSWTDEMGWMPIGRKAASTSCDPFHGNFDGKNHTIYGLKINDAKAQTGLFGYAVGSTSNPATIQNIVVKDAEVAGGTELGQTYDGKVGIIVGATSKALIQNCHVTGTVASPAKSVGGIVGYQGSGTQNYIRNCSANVVVTGYTQCGYIVGYLPPSSSTPQPENCEGTGTIHETEA